MSWIDAPWENARLRLWVLLCAGLGVQVLGCIMAFANLPTMQLGPSGPVILGDLTRMLIGILGLGLGGVASLTAVIGFGVSLGLTAHEQDRNRP